MALTIALTESPLPRLFSNPSHHYHTLLCPHIMALADPHHANDFPGDPFFHPIPHQPNQNAWVSCRHRVHFVFNIIPPQVPPAPVNGQPEGHREDIPPQVRGIAGPGRVHIVHQDYHPQPYVFPDVGFAQGILAQAQPDAPVGTDSYFHGYMSKTFRRR